jgi:hypothetical protein
VPSTLAGRLIPPAVLGGGAVGIGILAGVNPAVAVAAALSVLFVLADLAIGLAVFTVLSFAAQIPALQGPAVSVAKLAGLLLAISWIATVATGGIPDPNSRRRIRG